MGVDYYNCDVCDEIYCDCGHCGTCEECMSGLCGICYDEAVEKFGMEDDLLVRCQVCSGDFVSDLDVINFLLEKTKGSREDVENEIRRKRQ